MMRPAGIGIRNSDTLLLPTTRLATVRLSASLRALAPSLLFALRMWVAVCLAITVAFWLELDNPYWAGATAAIVCQPLVGASLRKGWFRMVGTVVGAIAAVVISGCFPQNRVEFFLALALWAGICSFVATLLRNFAAYAAALAGFTAVIVGADQLGAVGGLNGDAFMLGITRATEICIGSVCAGVVLASTDFGRARRQLAMLLFGVSQELTGHLIAGFHSSPAEQAATATVRRDLTRRVAALDPILDAARGEAPELRFNPRPLQAAMDGLFSAMSAWSAAANHLASLPAPLYQQQSSAILQRLPPEMTDDAAATSSRDPEHVRAICWEAAGSVLAMPVSDPSQRLLVDRVAKALLGILGALDAVVMLQVFGRPNPRQQLARIRIADWLPPVLNGLRAFLTIVGAALVWIVTAWPGGSLMLVFSGVILLLMTQRVDQIYHLARGLLLGTILTVVLAGIVDFAVLPTQPDYFGFCLALGLVFVPCGLALARGWLPQIFLFVSFLFVVVLGPANLMVYDTQTFYNNSLAVVVGALLAMLVLHLVPPLSPAAQSRRLLVLMLRDLRRMAAGQILPSQTAWEGRVHGRLVAMPDQAHSLRWAWLVANQTVGSALIRLRHVVARFNSTTEFDHVMQALARGDNTAAILALTQLDDALAAQHTDERGAARRLRARADVFVVRETLSRHAFYFGLP